jgi:hypothetical protein
MMDVTLLKDPVFMLISISNFFGMMGLYVPFVYLVDSATLVVCNHLSNFSLHQPESHNTLIIWCFPVRSVKGYGSKTANHVEIINQMNFSNIGSLVQIDIHNKMMSCEGTTVMHLPLSDPADIIGKIRT